MPRKYRPKPDGKRYKKYSEKAIHAALNDIRNGMSYRDAANHHGINYSVLYRRKESSKSQGGQTLLTSKEEEVIIQHLVQCADWGYPIEIFELRHIIQSFLICFGKQSKSLKENLPGKDWVYSFLQRNNDKISSRMSQLIKTSRAKVSPEIIEKYFENVAKELEEVPPSNIINYDETNLSDDPGRKKIIARRGCKYPERVINHSKTSTSIMFSGTAAGTVLPCYVVYKATNLYDTWTQNGPKKTRYNRTKSGWFDATCFEDWIKTVLLPYCKKLPGRKVLIGDNLSSHLSYNVVKMCKENNISFIFLPGNSTHLTQPLDIAFFRPLKIHWRNILTTWKQGGGAKLATVPKNVFPTLLKKLLNQIDQTSVKNLKNGFRKAGLYPINKQQVLQKLPKVPSQNEDLSLVSDIFLDYLKQMRYGDEASTTKCRKKKINVVPGKSVALEDFESDDTMEQSDVDQSDDAMEQTDVDSDDGTEQSDVDSDNTMEQSDGNAEDEMEQSNNQVERFNVESFNNLENTSDVPKIGSWIIIELPSNSTRCRSSKTSSYVCKIHSITEGDGFVGSLFRPKPTENFNGFVYTSPLVPDIVSFSFNAIKKVIFPPTLFGRGFFKFDIDWRTLK